MASVAKFSTGSVLGALAIGTALAATPIASGSAKAAIAGKPNLAHYCRTYYGRGSFPVFNYRLNAPTCARRGNYSVRYYRINFARACKLSYGSFAYRRYGRTAYCVRGTTTRYRGNIRTSKLITPNLGGYCRSRYGAGARVNFSYRQGGYVCSKPYYGRYGFIHYRISMSSACYYTARTTSFRYYGDRRVVRCIRRV